MKSQLLQPILLGEMLHSFNHLHGPSLDSHQYSLYRGAQNWPQHSSCVHQCSGEGKDHPLELCSGSALCLLWGQWPCPIAADLQAEKELRLLLVFTILGVSIPKPSKHRLCLPLLWHSSFAWWYRWLPAHCRQGAHLLLPQPQQEAWRKESCLRSYVWASAWCAQVVAQVPAVGALCTTPPPALLSTPNASLSSSFWPSFVHLLHKLLLWELRSGLALIYNSRSTLWTCVWPSPLKVIWKLKAPFDQE